MRMNRSLLTMLPFMLMADPGGIPLGKRKFINQNYNEESRKRAITLTIDRVIEELVTRGVCRITDSLFLIIKDSIQNKLRGEVLFHCDIESKSIFLTYTKAK